MYMIKKGSIYRTIKADSLDESKRIGDNILEYTCKDVVIEDFRGNIVSRRVWHLVPRGSKFPEEKNIIKVHDGYYSDWT